MSDSLVRTVVALLLMAGCGAPSSPGATVPTVAEPAPSGVARAQAVMDALDARTGAALQALAAAGVPDRSFHELLSTTFADRAFDEHRDALGEAAARGLPGWRRPPGGPRTRVRAVTDRSPTCLILSVHRDWSAAFGPVPVADGVVVLHPATANPTGWVVVEDGRTATQGGFRCRG